ncbi:MAG: hypothetical protein ABIJ08_01580 [Nanoarchaeota archaeon]
MHTTKSKKGIKKITKGKKMLKYNLHDLIQEAEEYMHAAIEVAKLHPKGMSKIKKKITLFKKEIATLTKIANSTK